MGGAPQVAMRVALQIWQIVFALQTLQVFRLAFRKKAQYVVVISLCIFFTIKNLSLGLKPLDFENKVSFYQ